MDKAILDHWVAGGEVQFEVNGEWHDARDVFLRNTPARVKPKAKLEKLVYPQHVIVYVRDKDGVAYPVQVDLEITAFDGEIQSVNVMGWET